MSSSAHEKGQLEMNDFSFATELEGYIAYATSKLANVLFTAALAERLAGTSVTAYSVDPGVITTNLLQIGWGITGDPVEQGARTPVYLATAEDLDGANGGYFVDCSRVPPSPAAQDARLAESLWQSTEELLRPHLHVNPYF
jgi:NAD(P)-dependent dehydrogenase (short-subunit alcohol dehydrogenase family)